MTSVTRTTRLQKWGLLFGALVSVFLLLEILLRLGAFFFLLRQDHVNHQSLGVGREFKILCLGESTTALGGESAYPRQLEDILNKRQTQIHFKVINKGVPATTTDQILARLPLYLKDVKPDLVIAMMGVNDPVQWNQISWAERASRYSKAFKLIYMIVQHWSVKKDDVARQVVDKEIQKWNQQAELDPSVRLMAELVKANLYRSANCPQEEWQSIQKAIALDPKNSQAWFLLGVYYERQAEFQKALDAFRKSNAQVSNEFRLNILGHIGQCQKFLNQSEEALKTYQTIIAQSPRHLEAYDVIGDIYFDLKQFALSLKSYEMQLMVNPQKSEVYGKLAHCYRLLGQVHKSDVILKEGIRINPQDPGLWYEQGYVLMERQNWAEAKAMLLKALNLNPQNQHGVNQKIYEKLLECSEQLRQPREVAIWQEKIKQTASEYNVMTKKNYDALIRELHRQKIPLIAMQYPRRPLKPLRQMVADVTGKGVTLLDSQEVFNQAIESNGYDDVFTDRFAGDFGHCTPKGNTLLANQVAEVILKQFHSEKE